MKVLLFYLLTGFAASCGQQGPLYLPEEDQSAGRRQPLIAVPRP